MKLIIGLGNPGPEYQRTRHNAGWLAMDRLASRHGLSDVRVKFHAAMTQGSIGGDKCVLLKPQTFMNRSGLSVGEAATFYKLDPTQVLVLVDDVALPLGSLRLRGSGSAGGHNGLIDIERALGTRGYPRLRLGIDPPPPRVPQKDWVLGRFSDADLATLEPALDRAADAAEVWVAEGVEAAMNRFNG